MPSASGASRPPFIVVVFLEGSTPGGDIGSFSSNFSVCRRCLNSGFLAWGCEIWLDPVIDDRTVFKVFKQVFAFVFLVFFELFFILSAVWRVVFLFLSVVILEAVMAIFIKKRCLF